MATALIELAGELFEGLAAVFRAKSFLEFAKNISKANTILKFKDVVKYAHLDEKFKNFVRETLFNNLETHKFIFENEEALKEYILSIDNNAKICKVLELYEVDLYLVEFSDIQLFLNVENEGIFEKLGKLMFLNQLFLYTNDFLAYSLNQLRNKEVFLENKLIEYVNNYIKYLENEKNNLQQKIEEIINKYKEEDINNTYCLRCSCSCCCGCEKGSCCCSCSCDCNLVHYIQSWEDAKNEILKNVENIYKNEIDKLKNDFINKNNKNSYIYLLYNELTNKENKNSYIMLFLLALEQLLFNMRHKAKNKLLFAVLKENNIKKLYKKLFYKKTNVMRYTYEFLEKIRFKKIEYNAFIEMLRIYLFKKTNIRYTRKQVITIYNEVVRRYNLRKLKSKKNNETYIIIY